MKIRTIDDEYYNNLNPNEGKVIHNQHEGRIRMIRPIFDSIYTMPKSFLTQLISPESTWQEIFENKDIQWLQELLMGKYLVRRQTARNWIKTAMVKFILMVQDIEAYLISEEPREQSGPALGYF